MKTGIIALICISILISICIALNSSTAKAKQKPIEHVLMLKIRSIVPEDAIPQDTVIIYPNAKFYGKGNVIAYHGRLWDVMSQVK